MNMNFERGFQWVIRSGYVFGILVIIVFLPFSKFILSVGMWIVTVAWTLDRVNIRRLLDFFSCGTQPRKIIFSIPFMLGLWAVSIAKGFRAFFRAGPALILASVFALHVLGLIFTTDFDYAFRDLRIKLPMILLPLYLSTSKAFSKQEFHGFMAIFFLNILIVTIANTWNLTTYDYIDIRDISKHVSHVILALLICLAQFTVLYFIVRKSHLHWAARVAGIILIGWFLVYMIISRSFTGIAVTLITLMVLSVVYIFLSRKYWLKSAFAMIFLSVLIGGFFYIRSVVNDYYTVESIDPARLEKFSPRGNPYVHIPENRHVENGHYVWIFIQWEELREAWNKRSEITFDSLDRKGQEIKFTVIRYMTSKGLRKDADGMAQLTSQDISAIERGVPNVINLDRFSIRGRLYELLMGYDTYISTGNPTGSSMMQRLEFWKASTGIIGENWLTGVGSGDLNEAFALQYEKMQTKLAPDQRWRSHNQFLSITIAFGLIGLAWFLLSLIYPAWYHRGFRDYFFLVFFIIGILSMFTEDTLESQAGVTFFYFFYSFFLFARREQDRL
jgi:hypothetical protein